MNAKYSKTIERSKFQINQLISFGEKRFSTSKNIEFSQEHVEMKQTILDQ